MMLVAMLGQASSMPRREAAQASGKPSSFILLFVFITIHVLDNVTWSCSSRP
jgi:hypothetical protein